MSANEVIEGTAHEVNGTELEVRPEPPAALFGTSDPVEVVEAATRVADSLAAVIRAKGLFSLIQGKAHVRVEGWQLLGSMLGVTAVCTETEAVDGGFRATVEARTADGRVVGRADALCTKHEKRGPWKSADDYARLSMAQTRATSKALKGPLGFVVSLAGYQTTPAEEMTFAEQTSPEPEDTTPPVTEEQVATIGSLMGKAKAAGLSFERLSLMFSGLGAEAPSIDRGDSKAKATRALSAEQAEQLASTLDAFVSEAADVE